MYMARAHQFVLPFKMLGLGLLVFLPLLEAADTGNFTYVTQAVSNAEDTAHCINGGDQFPCFTLAYVANQISSSSTIRIKVSELDINDTVSFINVSNVTIEGSSARTVLRCNCINCGVEFKHSQNITIKFLAFTGCRVHMRTFHIGAALVVYKCCNFFIENTNFFKNTETGLSLIDTHGYVDIHNTTMYGNGVGECQNCSGLSINFTKSIARNWSIYSIEDCHLWKNRASFGGGISLEFTGNSANNKVSLRNVHLKENGAKWGGGIFVGFSNRSKHNEVFLYNVASYKNMWKNETHENSYGGGIGLKFTRNSANNSVSLRDVHLEENAATWGGGILIEFTSRSDCNQVNLDNVTAYDNTAYKAGGGIDIGFIKSTSTPPITNIVFIENSNFIGNYARYGGGTAIYASSTTRGMEEAHHSDNTLVFRSCNWEGNGAHYFGSAIDVSPFAYDALGSLYFPHPKFVNCTFHSNNMKKQDFINNDLRPRQYNVGSFAVYGFEVQFEDKVEFYDHTSTALHVTQSIVTFLNNTEALFQNNSGYKGGAMSLSGSSSLWLYPNTTLNFHNNTASDRGGAIYHTTQNYHDFISSRTCFIKSYTNEQQEMPQLIFDGNNATQAGKSMYSTTFLPCYFEQSMGLWNLSRSDNHTVADALNKIANFHFVEQNYQEALATSGLSLNFIGNKRLDVVPGKTVAIPINMTDELGSCYPSIFRVVSDQSAKTCKTDRFYTLDKIVIKGKENTKCNLSLISVSLRATEFKVTVSVEKCPPGFHTDNESCICSAYSKKHAYHGISTCHDRRPFAYLKQGFWAGFDTDESLLTATPCPSSFCVAKVNKSAGPGIALPQRSSPKALEHIICQPHRTGWLCGRCQTNRTIYYHSPSYRCGSQGACVCGILFYLLSEILPIAVMFSVIAIFDIRFTTGTASGLVFFAQVIDTVSLNMKWNLEMSKSIDSLSILYKVIYGLFNFSFFNLEALSFCLWKNATVLDVIAFRYVSVVFAFFLLLLIVLFLKYCTCNCLLLKNDRLRRNRSRSVIHSISALLVTCYAQCTNISFHILAKTTLKGAGGEVKHDVTLFGGVHYFQKDHLMYAVAACFCLSTIVALPPLLLLVYPGYTTIFSFCKLNETRPLRIVSQLFMKLKPFLDSFQGCYKDKLRFFSGFYFVSRVVISAVNAFVSSILETFIFTEIILLLLLGAYAICHPFQKAKDNINNGLILLNMTIIGCLTILAYSQNADDTHIVTTALTIRLILLYLPIVCVCANMVKGAAGSYIKKRKKKIDLDDLRFEDTHNLQVIDHNYLPFQEVAVDSTEQSPEDSDSLYREDILEYM